MDELNALDALLDGTTPAEEQEETPEQAQEEQEQEETPAQPEPPKQNKQEYAFAQMRAQNNQLKTLLSKMAQATGLEYKDENELISKLNDDALTRLAQKQNIPVEYLQRLELLEQRNQVYEAEQRNAAAALGFQNVKKTYNLTDAQLMDYASELDKDGKNPFLQEVDLMADYKLRHYDEIMQKQIDAAVQAALAKSSAADTHSSKPATTGGRRNSAPEKVTTVAALDALLDGK